jgi:UDP-N-acetylmuramate dehydrogenase
LNLIIHQDINLSDKNWFRTGGNAKFYCEPKNNQQFIEALEIAQKSDWPIFVLGLGANILISDNGWQGMVIRPAINKIQSAEPYNLNGITHREVTAGAGVIFQDLINYCLDNNLMDLQEFSGIPGTVGGSVFINIHYFNALLSNYLVKATVVEKATGKLMSVDNQWFEFGYNKSKLQTNNYYLLDATFRLTECTLIESAYLKGRRDETIRYRNWRYPSSGTCGSFFRNFSADEVSLESNGKKMIYVAYYLDKLGIKGELKMGGAIVSHQHANMLVNTGNASSKDIIDLARTMQQMVYDKFAIICQPECIFVGFEKYPLLQ